MRIRKKAVLTVLNEDSVATRVKVHRYWKARGREMSYTII
jgi:hypothetical protein